MKLALLIVTLAAAAAAADKTFKGKGLQKGAPAMNEWVSEEPGTTKPVVRAYRGAPPVVPHSVAGLAITREDNACLGCHLEGMEVAEGHKATKVPPSHFTDARTKETRTDTVVGARYQCLQCHPLRTR